MTTAGSTTHQLDPLRSEELEHAAAIVRHDPRYAALPLVRFVSIELLEPAKGESASERRVVAVLLDRTDGRTIEAVVSLADNAVQEWRVLSGVQGAITVNEIEDAERAVRSDPRFQAAMRRRGIEDMRNVQIDPWPPGNFGSERERSLRLSRAIAFWRDDLFDNGYAHPIEGVIALVDLNRMEVLDVEDHGVVPIPPEPGNFDPAAVGPMRDDVKPLEITQPEGSSFVVDGHHVRWQRWDLRVGFNGREGLVLHDVGYEDDGRRRSILARASIAEMTVPYGDPSPTHFFKSVFDAGENGIGIAATSLTRGCDCLGEIHYFDAVVTGRDGEPAPIPHAICMHEEDYGVLWRHIDWRHKRGEVRRSRRLVISSFSTIGNYDYGFFWYLYQDGSIECEVKLTGILSTGAVAPGATPAHGTLIAPQLNGPLHQHFFSARLDFDVDGLANAVDEVEAEPVPPGPANPHGNAFVSRRRRLGTELAARRQVDPLAARVWDIVNPNVRNRLGQPVAYRLVPGDNVRPMAQPDSAVLRRAGFIAHHLWVTPYDPAERFPAGEYPNQHPGGAGLPEWTARDRDIDGTDIVVWYTFGHHHVPRPEDWPIMPMAYIGFRLKPVGFFDRNPALDVPVPDHCAVDHVGTGGAHR